MDEFHELPFQSTTVNLHKHGITNKEHQQTEIINRFQCNKLQQITNELFTKDQICTLSVTEFITIIHNYFN